MIEFDAYNKIENDLHVELFVHSTTTTTVVVTSHRGGILKQTKISSILSSVFIDVLKLSL